VLGICGGCQLLGRAIADPDGIEGAGGATEEGLGLLDLATTFHAEKTLRLHAPSGYEIHHGRVTGQTRAGAVTGTMVHGSLEDDGTRAAYLAACPCCRQEASLRPPRPGAPRPPADENPSVPG
jgi:adenosylcobyric acid synthase